MTSLNDPQQLDGSARIDDIRAEEETNAALFADTGNLSGADGGEEAVTPLSDEEASRKHEDSKMKGASPDQGTVMATKTLKEDARRLQEKTLPAGDAQGQPHEQQLATSTPAMNEKRLHAYITASSPTSDDITADIQPLPLSRNNATVPNPIPGAYTSVPGVAVSGLEDQDPVEADATVTAVNEGNELLVEATLVGGHDEEAQAQQSSRSLEVFNAEPMQLAGILVNRKQAKIVISCGLIFCIAAVATIVALVVVLVAPPEEKSTASENGTLPESTMSPTQTLVPMLEQLKERGVVRCGVFEGGALFALAGDRHESGYCKGIAAAVFGNASKHELVTTPREHNFDMLSNGTIDVMVSHLESTMETDVYKLEGGNPPGFTLAIPYLYTQFAWSGLPEYVYCVNNNFNTRGNCSDLSFCATPKSIFLDPIKDKMPASHFVTENFDSFSGIVQGFMGGKCNIFADFMGTGAFLMRFLGYRGDFVESNVNFGNAVMTMATRDDDPEWSDFVQVLTLAFFAAEQRNISQMEARRMGPFSLFGDEYADMLINAVAASGNYGDIYERAIENVAPRKNVNRYNDGTSGLLFTMPWDGAPKEGPAPLPGSTMHKVVSRGQLRCGVRTGRPGFAMLYENGRDAEGIDVDFCRALAAGIFGGLTETELIPVVNEADGYRMLSGGEVDVLSGFIWSLQNDVREPTTAQGYSFSQPFFYGPVEKVNRSSPYEYPYEYPYEFEDNLALVTRQDDPTFTSFVNWAVSSTFYAEERGITQDNANDMPEINLFGPDFAKLARDIIYISGAYGAIYDRNLGSILPRGGRNQINSVEIGGPQIYIPPGLFEQHE